VSLQAKQRTVDGNAFHAFGPATVKDLSVKRRCVLGTMKSAWTDQRHPVHGQTYFIQPLKSNFKQLTDTRRAGGGGGENHAL